MVTHFKGSVVHNKLAWKSDMHKKKPTDQHTTATAYFGIHVLHQNKLISDKM